MLDRIKKIFKQLYFIPPELTYLSPIISIQGEDMKDIIQKECKTLRLFGIKILEFNTIITVDGRNEIKKPKKEIITNKDYEILEECKSFK